LFMWQGGPSLLFDFFYFLKINYGEGPPVL